MKHMLSIVKFIYIRVKQKIKYFQTILYKIIVFHKPVYLLGQICQTCLHTVFSLLLIAF